MTAQIPLHMTVKERQRLLRKHGFDPGPIDGVDGPRTRKATIAFKRSRGLRARDYVGPLTKMALREGITPADEAFMPGITLASQPIWMRLAYSYLGLREIPGPRHNKEILSWWEMLSLPFNDDETPWCAGFVNAMILKAGLPIVDKNRAAALGWRWNGYGKKLDGPALGAVMSMTRPGKPGSGHMTFVAGRDRSGNIMGLGGNQGNMVSINPYDPTARDAQYHYPETVSLPVTIGLETLPMINGTGAKLVNEA